MPKKNAVDDQLIEAARKAGGHATADDAIRHALEEYIARRRRLRIVELFGRVDYSENYDYKTERRKDAS